MLLIVPGDTARHSTLQAPSGWGQTAIHMKEGAVGGKHWNMSCHLFTKAREMQQLTEEVVPVRTVAGCKCRLCLALFMMMVRASYDLPTCLRMTDLMRQPNRVAKHLEEL